MAMFCYAWVSGISKYGGSGEFLDLIVCDTDTAWKVSKHGVVSGPYFPVFGLNPYSVRIQQSTDQK